MDIREKLERVDFLSFSQGSDYVRSGQNDKVIDDREPDINKIQEQIITAWEAMEAEIERLRWHYPDRGELPPEENIFAEVGLITVSEYNYYTYKGDGSWSDGCWSGRWITSNEIIRWRYV